MKKKSISLSDIKACVFFLGILIILSGCKSSKKEPAETTQPAEEKTSREVVIEELAGYPIPTSFEIIQMINEAGAPYIYLLSNAADKVNKYFTSEETALNLGVYGADLSYATTYGMKQETMLYLESSRKLIDNLGITTPFNINYAQRIEDNLDDRDSLIAIISNSFTDTWNHLTTNKKNKQALLVVSGSWIEGLYITTHLTVSAEDKSLFLEIIAKQKNSLQNLLEVFEAIKDDVDVADVYSGLMDLNEIYEDIDEKLTEEQLEQVLTSINQLREGIV